MINSEYLQQLISDFFSLFKIVLYVIIASYFQGALLLRDAFIRTQTCKSGFYEEVTCLYPRRSIFQKQHLINLSNRKVPLSICEVYENE